MQGGIRLSDSITTKDARRVRNIVLIAVGAAIIVATYLYLVLGQPAEVGESSTSSAGLIAMAGYLIGAVLLAIGSIHRLPTATIAMIPVAIALNIVIGQIVAVIGLPVYIDSIGTVLVSAVAGPAAGVVTGILTNVIWGLTLSPIALPFAVVQVVIGVLAGYAARWGMFRRWYLAPLAGAATGVVAAMISAPIAAFIFGGATANFTPHAPTKVDFDKEDRAPLLFISGGMDNIVPASVNRSNARHYNSGDVELKEFPERSHYTLGMDGWEEVADYALDWGLKHAAAHAEQHALEHTEHATQ